MTTGTYDVCTSITGTLPMLCLALLDPTPYPLSLLKPILYRALTVPCLTTLLLLWLP
jgi:hypothetical protein